MDRPIPKQAADMAGLSLRNGPIEDDTMDIDTPATNGASKRKSRSSITSTKVNYKDDSESDDGAPLVRDDLQDGKNCCGASLR